MPDHAYLAGSNIGLLEVSPIDSQHLTAEFYPGKQGNSHNPLHVGRVDPRITAAVYAALIGSSNRSSVLVIL